MAHVDQVAVDITLTPMKLLKFGSFCDGALAALEAVEVGDTFRSQLTILAVLII